MGAATDTTDIQEPAETGTVAAPQGANDDRACRQCAKPERVCVCDLLSPAATRHRVLVLQHPQEHDHLLGTVPLLRAALRHVDVRVGLSWASLAHALDRRVATERWALVFPRSAGGPQAGADGKAVQVAGHGALGARVIRGSGLRPAARSASGVDRRMAPPRAPAVAAMPPLEGIILLDGTWSQAKTLLYRNPWLHRLPRLALPTDVASIYGRLRREPRRGHVSTLEAAVAALGQLGSPQPPLQVALRALRTLAQRLRDAPDLLPGPTGASASKGQRRR